jgi:hypothetical protein
MTAGPDVIRGSGPNQNNARVSRVTQCGFSQSNGSTVSHHAIITLAIGIRPFDAISTSSSAAL